MADILQFKQRKNPTRGHVRPADIYRNNDLGVTTLVHAKNLEAAREALETVGERNYETFDVEVKEGVNPVHLDALADLLSFNSDERPKFTAAKINGGIDLFLEEGAINSYEIQNYTGSMNVANNVLFLDGAKPYRVHLTR